MSTRDDVVGVLAGLTVDLGPDRDAAVIDARPYIPDSLAPFTAWPVWVATTFLTTCIAEETWSVLVTLTAGDPDAWARDGEALLWPVRDALLKLGAVTRVEPVTVALGDATTVVPVMRFTLTT